MSHSNNISVLIPAYNEEPTIGETIKAALTIPKISQVVVVDDGSRDRTAIISHQLGADVISLADNVGKGGAINAGIPKIRGEVVLLLDADLGKSACYANKLILPVIQGCADMTVAVFPKTNNRSGFGLVKGLARTAIKRKTGVTLQAPLSGQRAFRIDVLKHCFPFSHGFGAEVGFTLKALHYGYKIKEVPVEMYHRFTGRNLPDFIHRGKQFRDIVKVILSH